MSSNPIHVTPNTTDVEISILESPYSQVLLDTIQYSGQTFSIVAATSSIQILENPILVSTASNQSFIDGSISTLINQPQGYLTLQSKTPSTFVFLNSFPFRNEYVSAGVYSLLTSTLNTQQISSIGYYTSVLNVENLIVSKNFFQSAGISLTTSVSTLGNVSLQSTLSVYGDTFFSSFFSTSGSVSIQSSLSIHGNLSIDSSLQNTSTLYAHSIRTLGIVCTNALQIQGSFVANDIFIEGNAYHSLDIAGGAIIQGTVSTLSSIYISTFFKTSSLQVYGSTITSSLSVFGSLTNTKDLRSAGDVSTRGNVNIQGNTLLNSSIQIQGNTNIQNNFVVDGDILIEKNFSTNTIEVDSFYVDDEFKQFLAEFHIQKQGILEENLTSKNIESLSTFIGGNARINLDAQFDSLYVKDDISMPLSFLSILSTLQVGDSISVENNLLLRNNLESKNISLGGGLNVTSSIVALSSFFQNNLTVKNLYTQNFYTQNIDLVLNLVGNSFFVNDANIANKAITDTLSAEYAYASSFQGGPMVAGSTLFSLEGNFNTNMISTFYFSSISLLLSTTQESSFTSVLNSVAINHPKIDQTFAGSGIAYITNEVRIDKNLSTSALFGEQIIGKNFEGDGLDLANVSFPNTVQIQTIQASTLYVNTTFASTVNASNGYIYEQLNSVSTFKVGNLNIYGNANSFVSLSTNSIYTLQGNNKTLLLDTMFINNLTSLGQRDSVMINGFSNVGSTISSYVNGYKFYVNNGTLRLKDLISPNFVVNADTVFLDSIFVSTFFIQQILINPTVSTNFGTLYVSSGVIGSENGTFFIPESSKYSFLSTNTIQPIQSTLIFNSTLYASPGKVGIGAFPNYTLDVPTSGNITSTLTVLNHVSMNELKHFKSLSSIWLAPTNSNILQSSDNAISFTQATINNQGLVFNSVYYGGTEPIWFLYGRDTFRLYYIDSTNSIVPLPESEFMDGNQTLNDMVWNGSLWVAAINPQYGTGKSLWYSLNGLQWYECSNAFNLYGQTLAWNGSMWIAGGNDNYYDGDLQEVVLNPSGFMKYSYNGKEWFDSETGGFFPNNLINNWYFGGANSITWAKNIWVAVGDSPTQNDDRSTVMRSVDGIRWSYEGIQGMFRRGIAIQYNGNLTVAVGPYFFSGTPVIIYYSEDLGKTWNRANNGGTTIFSMTNIFSVDDYWIAEAAIGYYKSFNGKVFEYLGSATPKAYSSNTTNFVNIQKPGISTNLFFVENHQFGTQYQYSTNTFGFNPSSLNFNYTLFLDQRQNTTIGSVPGYFNNYNSSFVVDGTVFVSTLVSSPFMKVGAYFLGMQTV
jgi:hypothetical protein